MELRPVEEESEYQPLKFSLPKNRKVEWLHAICRKKDYEPLDPNVLEEYGQLTNDFHTALYYDELLRYQEAAQYYAKILDRSPLLESDKMRILYSRIRFLSISDHTAFQDFFDDFKQTNHDPFWWKIIILSSVSFMKKTLIREIQVQFTGEEKIFLEHAIKTAERLNFKRSVKKRKIFYRLLRPIYKVIKKSMKNSDIFERTKF